MLEGCTPGGWERPGPLTRLFVTARGYGLSMSGMTWILDVDGTLVDTNYHHAIAWFRAFRAHGVTLPVWRLHRHVGMGGDKLVGAVAGEDVERGLGDEVRARWEQEFDLLIDEVQPLAGAADLVRELSRRGDHPVLASSAVRPHLDHFIELLGVRDSLAAATSKDDVECSKPDPDLVRAALAAVPSSSAVMLGDTPWDVDAAGAAGVPTLCVLTGGYGEAELRDAGALDVYGDLHTLLDEIRAGRLDAVAAAAG